MGNRRTDPYSQKLTGICESSPGWPVFTRVFPILDWTYLDVWAFLKGHSLVYCTLYNEGYTSLGEKHNSQKNPFLRRTVAPEEGEQVEEEVHLPAFLLGDGELERFSRREAGGGR
uniref:FAD synthase n=1 Tax=Strombidium rassoulzadegani TaxID=1082188 RepID=A0A7S3CLK3_9SPIT|mmetsp:Transcript_1572/g.2775  ORF Transcript_1572/g.2775 Transcript_1572/m.2775 type:complete len:115 (+) Transcript_1572:751-1095(+)